jgi:hypothetical protein
MVPITNGGLRHLDQQRRVVAQQQMLRLPARLSSSFGICARRRWAWPTPWTTARFGMVSPRMDSSDLEGSSKRQRNRSKWGDSRKVSDLQKTARRWFCRGLGAFFGLSISDLSNRQKSVFALVSHTWAFEKRVSNRISFRTGATHIIVDPIWVAYLNAAIWTGASSRVNNGWDHIAVAET